ncbi:hypothetical protein BO85DRAFT_474430 [Aspergillus piperis CBS 112811]|uniref:Uncharacterized protein n=1 Tax=Aspergillus piperis CBS 112811 TaxID=1448313 RepID=A0A8G1R9Z2_9EURO|nr:hypothetical protein BO85DRAFT_474430 [Aspergillus piperis CBS 112811]RAH61862.1 hypothetical protein BO85DRAFT_474430 [Aspergillus piperis CBS 112811]
MFVRLLRQKHHFHHHLSSSSSTTTNIRVESKLEEYYSSRVINLEKEEGWKEGRKKGGVRMVTGFRTSSPPVIGSVLESLVQFRRNKPLEIGMEEYRDRDHIMGWD